jgi:hypothetical protein
MDKQILLRERGVLPQHIMRHEGAKYQVECGKRGKVPASVSALCKDW